MQVHKNIKEGALTSNIVTARLSFLEDVTKLAQTSEGVEHPNRRATELFHACFDNGLLGRAA